MYIYIKGSRRARYIISLKAVDIYVRTLRRRICWTSRIRTNYGKQQFRHQILLNINRTTAFIINRNASRCTQGALGVWWWTVVSFFGEWNTRIRGHVCLHTRLLLGISPFSKEALYLYCFGNIRMAQRATIFAVQMRFVPASPRPEATSGVKLFCSLPPFQLSWTKEKSRESKKKWGEVGWYEGKG